MVDCVLGKLSFSDYQHYLQKYMHIYCLIFFANFVIFFIIRANEQPYFASTNLAPQKIIVIFMIDLKRNCM